MIKKFFVILIHFLILGVSFSLTNAPLSTCSFGNDFKDNTVITDPKDKLKLITPSPSHSESCATDGCVLPMFIGVISWIIILFSLFPIGKILMGIIAIFTTKDPLLKYTIGIKHVKSGIHWLITIILLLIGMYLLYSITVGFICGINCHGISIRTPLKQIYNLSN